MTDALIFRPNVVFCGENPQIFLTQPGSEGPVASASYWHCTYSPCGEGNVMLLYLNESTANSTGHPTHTIFTDNRDLARYVTDTFNQHFDGWGRLGFNQVEAEFGRFFPDTDSRKYVRIACHTSDKIVTLRWRDIRSPELRMFSDLNGGGFGVNRDEHYDVHTVICLCGDATIQIGNRRVRGLVQTAERNGRFMSSAFLAFSEVWMKRD
jgi:hypothetical protein